MCICAYENFRALYIDLKPTRDQKSSSANDAPFEVTAMTVQVGVVIKLIQDSLFVL